MLCSISTSLSLTNDYTIRTLAVTFTFHHHHFFRCLIAFCCILRLNFVVTYFCSRGQVVDAYVTYCIQTLCVQQIARYTWPPQENLTTMSLSHILPHLHTLDHVIQLTLRLPCGL